MTYEDVKRQRAEREKRFVSDVIRDVTGAWNVYEEQISV